MYRNFVMALHFYDIQRAAYARPELFLRGSSGEVCLQDVNGSPFWNFSHPETRAFFLDEMVTSAAREAGSNLVFFDSNDAFYCNLVDSASDYAGPSGGSSCPELRYSASQLRAMYSDVVDVLRATAEILNAAGKAPIYSMVNSFGPAGEVRHEAQTSGVHVTRGM